MKRISSASYPTNGSSALKPRSTGFTVVDGGRSSSHRASHTIVQEHLTALQIIKSLLVTAALIAALGAVLVFSNSRSQARFEEAFSSVSTITITVHSGDSLWDIASEYAPSNLDTGAVVRWIRIQNNLDTATIVPGQTLVVPSRG